MKKQKEAKHTKKKYSALAGRLFIAGITLSLVGILILWDMGYIEIPFLVRRARREETEILTKEETETLETDPTDWGAMAKSALNNIYKAEFVENFSALITTATYDKETTSLVKTILRESYTDYAFGFLVEESGCILRASDLTRIPGSEGYLLTGKTDANQRAVFRRKEGGAFFVLNEETLAFEEIHFDLKSIIIDRESQEETELIQENGLYGYKGRYKENRKYKTFTIEPQYPIAFPFVENYAIAADANGKITIYDCNGNHVFSAYNLILPEASREDAESFYYFNHGILRVIFATYDESGNVISTRESAINSRGEEIVFPNGYRAVSYAEGFFILEKDGRYGYYSYNNEWITSPVYTECRPFSEGVAVLKDANGKYGLIDSKGDFILPCYFERIENLSAAHTLLYSENTGWCLLSKVEGIYPPKEKDELVEELPPQTKVTITRGPQNTFEHEEEIIIEVPIIPGNTTREPHKEYWE